MSPLVRIPFCWLLAMAIALSAPLSHAAAARRLSARAMIQMHSAETQRLWTNLKIASSSSELRTKALGIVGAPARGIGSSILNDVFQASLIMAAAAVAQLAKDRMDRERLLAGYQPKFADVQRHSLLAAEDLLCGNRPKEAAILTEIGCSGEFWAGFVGGLGVRAVAQATVIQALRLLLKSNPTRAAIISTVGTFATSFLMLTGFQMSAYLWTQSIHVLNDKQKEERAHNLFGRAVHQWVSGNWETYKQTEDGQLAVEIFENMNNILIVDSSLRKAWVYNAWRFGLARGEMIVNLTILIGALSAGTALGASFAGLVGLAGWPAAGVTFLVASMLGAAVSASIVYMPDAMVGERITTLIQNIRSWLAEISHGLNRNHIDVAAQAFHLNRFQDPITKPYRKRYEQRLRYLIPALAHERMSIVGISFEKYKELQDKLDQAEALLAIAQEVVSNSDLRNSIQLSDGKTVMTYEEARAKHCARINAYSGQNRDCTFPLSLQLKKISEAKSKIKEGQEVLRSIAEHVLKKYNEDAGLFQGYLDKVDLQFPPDIAGLIKDEAERLSYLEEALGWNFGALHPAIRQQRELTFDSADELKLMKLSARDFVNHSYINGLNEAEYMEKLKIAIR